MSTTKTFFSESLKFVRVTQYIARQYLGLLAGRPSPQTRFFTNLYKEVLALDQPDAFQSQNEPSVRALKSIDPLELVSLAGATQIQIVNDVSSLVSLQPSYKGAFLTLYEQVLLNTFVRLRKPRVIFEFGTALGFTSTNFLSNAPADTMVYTLDLHDNRSTQPAIQAAFANARLVFLHGDSQTFDFEAYAEKVDFLFIDANHDAKWVYRDSLNALTMVAPGGLILWHDYSIWHPGVVEVLHFLSKKHRIQHISGTSLAVLTRE